MDVKTRSIVILSLLLCSRLLFGQTDYESVDQFLKSFSETLNAIDDYQCRISDWSVYEGESESRIANFYFLRPRYMRMEIILGTRFGDNGSRAVYLPDGSVTAKMKRLPFSRRLEIDEPLATTIRGTTLEETDLIGIREALVDFGEHSNVRIRSEDGLIVFTAIHPQDRLHDGLDTEVIFFDPETLLPVRVLGYIRGELVQNFVFSNYIVNSGIPRELFNVRYDAKRLSEGGRPTVASIPVSEEDLLESRFPGSN